MADTFTTFNGTWLSTKSEDWAVVEEILGVQGISWMLRKALRLVTPQIQMRVYDKDGALFLEVKRPGITGQVTVNWLLDGTPVSWEEGFKQRLSFTRVGDRIEVNTTSDPAGQWSNQAVWTVETEDGEKYHYRRSVFKYGEKELQWVSRYKYVISG
ncbi:hypothetical protein M427DRAFT_54925 [Gonapodya prolifera JEL478]|uniref:DUF1579 domain-containing protein n=1 Tax=Gonapodya prolifera (strain JEL478) TaxID=1344416 RepID=A0A139AKH1_GONPJ|nr:hypothetical protein M427DRAFT_54925 [Gonapodya prolifera JEL478]|eukprot:KXS17269.1 hypothetical protein M427DRAFT_54925 [Gonapodya prolifera JEL478]